MKFEQVLYSNTFSQTRIVMFTFPSLEVEGGSHLTYCTSPEVKVPLLEAMALLLTSLLP